MDRLNDIALVAQVLILGNTRAFDRLVRKYQSPLRRFFLSLTLGDTYLSDDLAQETFLKAYTGLKGFNNLSSFSTWLYRIAYNTFYDYRRTLPATEALEVTEVDARYSQAQPDLASRIDLYQALTVLSEAERTCLTLFYMEDQDQQKIAAITGYPLGTVKSHIARGKAKMADYLARNGYGGQTGSASNR
ncbi:MAG: sigma-70 family RNA polymerase sigma factor [Prevotellaceae bacterium]|nr:sigma-70 family RNA polymerase sigma factor [Prevotellaceae bacterium]